MKKEKGINILFIGFQKEIIRAKWEKMKLKQIKLKKDESYIQSCVYLQDD